VGGLGLRLTTMKIFSRLEAFKTTLSRLIERGIFDKPLRRCS